MNKLFTFIFFIIIGILLYYFNTIDSFSIGNQYALDDPINRLLYFFNLIVRNQEICDEEGIDLGDFRRRELLGDRDASCQINTIVGFFNALDIPLGPPARNYITSFGSNLGQVKYMSDVYKCLTNRESMQGLLFSERLDPKRPIELDDLLRSSEYLDDTRELLSSEKMSDINPHKIYIAKLKIMAMSDSELQDTDSPPYIMNGGGDDRHELELPGHSILMYKTNYVIFDRLCTSAERSSRGPGEAVDLDEDQTFTRNLDEDQTFIRIMTNLRDSWSLLHKAFMRPADDAPVTTEPLGTGNPPGSWSPRDRAVRNRALKENGVVCIFIDLCNKRMFAVTELDYPLTHDLLDAREQVEQTVPGSRDREIATTKLNQYNQYWKMKIILSFLGQIKTSISQDNSELILTRPLNQYNTDQVLGDWMPREMPIRPTSMYRNVDRRFQTLDRLSYFSVRTFESIDDPTVGQVGQRYDHYEDYFRNIEMTPYNHCYGKLNRTCYDHSIALHRQWSRCEPTDPSSLVRLKCVIDELRGEICVYSNQIEDRPISFNIPPVLNYIHNALEIRYEKGRSDVTDDSIIYKGHYEYNDQIDSILSNPLFRSKLYQELPIVQLEDDESTVDKVYVESLYNDFIKDPDRLIYLGIFQKSGSLPGVWQTRAFYLIFDDGHIYLMYGDRRFYRIGEEITEEEYTEGIADEQAAQMEWNLLGGGGASPPGSQFTEELITKGQIPIKFVDIPINKNFEEQYPGTTNCSNFFKPSINLNLIVGKSGDTTTIYLDDSRDYIELYSDDPNERDRLILILSFVKNLWNEENIARCSVVRGSIIEIPMSEPEPEPEEGSGPDYNTETESNIRTIIRMGYSNEEARNALEGNDGNIGRAIQSLVGVVDNESAIALITNMDYTEEQARSSLTEAGPLSQTQGPNIGRAIEILVHQQILDPETDYSVIQLVPFVWAEDTGGGGAEPEPDPCPQYNNDNDGCIRAGCSYDIATGECSNN
jgi:hypothetical protein